MKSTIANNHHQKPIHKTNNKKSIIHKKIVIKRKDYKNESFFWQR